MKRKSIFSQWRIQEFAEAGSGSNFDPSQIQIGVFGSVVNSPVGSKATPQLPSILLDFIRMPYFGVACIWWSNECLGPLVSPEATHLECRLGNMSNELTLEQSLMQRISKISKGGSCSSHSSPSAHVPGFDSDSRKRRLMKLPQMISTDVDGTNNLGIANMATVQPSCPRRQQMLMISTSYPRHNVYTYECNLIPRTYSIITD